MAQVIQVSELTLSDVENKFNLCQVINDSTFFYKWQHLPELSQSETDVLERVKNEFFYLNKYPMLEDLVKKNSISISKHKRLWLKKPPLPWGEGVGGEGFFMGTAFSCIEAEPRVMHSVAEPGNECGYAIFI